MEIEGLGSGETSRVSRYGVSDIKGCGGVNINQGGCLLHREDGLGMGVSDDGKIVMSAFVLKIILAVLNNRINLSADIHCYASSSSTGIWPWSGATKQLIKYHKMLAGSRCTLRRC
jgi:hypothetical protein